MKVALADAAECLLAAALEQVKAKEVGAIAVRTDISDPDAVRTLARRTEAELGPPWLVCNHFGESPFVPGHKLTPANPKSVMDANLWGVVNGVQVFASGMVERDAGHIVNIASTDLFGAPGAAPYVATAHAIVGLSESLYRELDTRGSQVGVTVVCPALVNTNVTTAIRDQSGPRKAGRAVSPHAREVPLHVPAADEFVEQIFAAVAARRFWLFPHTRQMHELAGCRSDTAVGSQRKSTAQPGVAMMASTRAAHPLWHVRPT
jgi:NAD(P)-dependent dehydrogenase (short-subunit alcohol dehydrogenase family)